MTKASRQLLQTRESKIQKRRTFVAERFCFRGAIDDWIFLGGPDDLKKLV
jgi:hypothetical protein